MDSRTHQSQIFIQFPDLQIPNRALILQEDSNLTLRSLKESLLTEIPFPIGSFFFTLNGKRLRDSQNLRRIPEMAPLSTLHLHLRLLGGGGDGGATGAESRDCYLKMYADKKPDKIDPNEQRLSKWLNCSLTNEPLKHPVVADKLGNLFNKETLVQGLLAKNMPKAFRHIKGLKDMIPLALSLIPGLDSPSEVDVGTTRFQCPISGLEFNGKYKFFAIRSCGHVLSAKALKEIKSSSCLVCYKEFEEDDKIVLNGSEEEVEVLRERMEEEKTKLKEKKGKKMKDGEEGVGVGVSRLSGKKHGIDNPSKIDGKIHVKMDGNDKKVENGGMKRLKSSNLVVPANATKEVYESIFTSSKKSNFKETYACRSLPLGRN